MEGAIQSHTGRLITPNAVGLIPMTGLGRVMLDAAFSPITCGGTDGCRVVLVDETNCVHSLVVWPPGVTQSTISSVPFTPPCVAGHWSVAKHFTLEVPDVELELLVVVVDPGVPDVVVVDDVCTTTL